MFFLHTWDPARFSIPKIAERYRLKQDTVREVLRDFGENYLRCVRKYYLHTFFTSILSGLRSVLGGGFRPRQHVEVETQQGADLVLWQGSPPRGGGGARGWGRGTRIIV